VKLDEPLKEAARKRPKGYRSMSLRARFLLFEAPAARSNVFMQRFLTEGA
jgi:hypothetical protein